MPGVRVSFSTVVLGNVVYLIGGYMWQNGVLEYLAAVDTYNAETEEWRDIPPMPIPLRAFRISDSKRRNLCLRWYRKK